ncbi:hypothetical protein GF314_14500 [bacterium]|nr:hypothetical protein [bacterium]
MRCHATGTLAVVALILTATSLAPQASATGMTPVYETTLSNHFLPSGRGLVVDDGGHAFVIGRWVGDQQENNIVVARISNDGELLWSRDIAGQDHDHATDLALDASGDLIVCGWTDSDDFPLVDPIVMPTNFRDAFVMRLAAGDGEIVFSTRLGGSYSDHAGGLAIDTDGSIVVAGHTASPDFPTVDALQDELNGPAYQYDDVFVTRLSPDGGSIRYSTYLGGGHDDRTSGLALGPDGQLVVVGTTWSDDFPVRNAVQPGHAGGSSDLFVASLEPGGGFLEYATYLGGEDVDRASNLVTGPDGSVYLAGITRSIGFPTTAGAFQEAFVGGIDACEIPFGGDYNCEDGVIARLTPAGDLVFSSFVGGSHVDELRDLDVRDDGSVGIVGYSRSSDFPPDGIEGSASIVVRRLDGLGSEILEEFTIFSSAANAGHGIGIGPGGDLHITGSIGNPAELYVARLSSGTVTGAPETPRSTAAIELAPAYPNPFNPSTELSFRLPRAAHVRLVVHDARGRRIDVLADATYAAGEHHVRWRPEQVRSGVYYARLAVEGEIRTGKLVLLK